MSLLILGFFVILLVTFGLIAVVTRPSQAEKALDRRLSTIGRAEAFTEGQSTAASRLMKAGDAPWLSDVLDRYEIARKLQLLIIQAGCSTTLPQFVFTGAGLAAVALFISYFLVPLPFAQVLITFCGGMLPLLWLRYKRYKRIKAFDNELANAADMMARALRAGHSVVGAIEILGDQTAEPSKSEFREVFRQQTFGLPLRDALMQLLDRVPSIDLRVVVTAILVQKDTGGNLGEILDRVVFVIRERVRIRGEIQVQTAQGRLTGWILTALPVIMMFLINLMNPGYSRILFDDPFGRKLIYAGLMFLTIGALIIRKMINSIEV